MLTGFQINQIQIYRFLGGPANVACALSKLGINTIFIGCLGMIPTEEIYQLFKICLLIPLLK